MLFLIFFNVNLSDSKSQQQTIAEIFIVVCFSLLIVGICILYLPSLKDFKELFVQIGNVTYVILYTIFAILFYTMIPNDILNTYSYIINPIILGVGALSFYKSSTQNYIDKFPSIENQFDCGKGENFNTVKGNEKRFCLLKPDADIKIKSVKEKPGWLERYPNFLEEGISLQELSDTYHFQKRVTQRGNVLDILNLKEIPLKDFNLDEVKEKLKANISEELKTRILRILSKDVPLSNLYGVGIKVLKPVLVVDGKKYPLKLFAISTKEIKDKEGNIVDEKEVDNRGTLYFITIIDNKATTLLLLDKEDDSDLYFQIKKHLATKKIDRDAEVLSPPTYIYEINLDTLMGVKAQGPTLIDPSTLPYKVRTDYRVGANFDHIIFGTGKIVATSAGSGGKGDSAGKVDWVDVKFPKPHLKGGKFTDIRRFDKVYTLVSPLLMK